VRVIAVRPSARAAVPAARRGSPRSARACTRACPNLRR